jgi:hypothetical protein
VFVLAEPLTFLEWGRKEEEERITSSPPMRIQFELLNTSYIDCGCAGEEEKLSSYEAI